jgi:hypothetical protein
MNREVWEALLPSLEGAAVLYSSRKPKGCVRKKGNEKERVDTSEPRSKELSGDQRPI